MSEHISDQPRHPRPAYLQSRPRMLYNIHSINLTTNLRTNNRLETIMGKGGNIDVYLDCSELRDFPRLLPS
jgi:hypothetical protein